MSLRHLSFTLLTASLLSVGCKSEDPGTTPGPTALVFSVEPGSTTAGKPFSPAVQITAVDANGQAVTSWQGAVQLALGNNPSSAELGGATSANAVNGVATFDGLFVHQAGGGFTLRATADGLASVDSSSFNITEPAQTATKLAVTTQPTNARMGATLTPIKVAIQDSAGATVTSSTASITVALGNNPNAGVLGGTKTVAAVNGVATFSDLTIDAYGIGYTLKFTSTDLTSATSNAFNINTRQATKLSVARLTTTVVAGKDFSPSLLISAVDDNGAVDTLFTGAITIALNANPGQATLSGTLTVTAAEGFAQFDHVSLDKVAEGYTIIATSGTLPSVTTGPITVTPGDATSLAFLTQPTNVVAGQQLSPDVSVAVLDAYGNLATSSAVDVILAVNRPNFPILRNAAVNGIATFSNIELDVAGLGYTFIASGNNLTIAESAPFDVTPGDVGGITIRSAPPDAVAGVKLTGVQFGVVDAFGNAITTPSTVAIALNPWPAFSLLHGTTTVTTVNGVATFDDLVIEKAGTGYFFVASVGLYNTLPNDTFAITPAAAEKLALVRGPTDTVTGQAITPGVVVAIQDHFGNTVTSSAAEVTIALDAPASATLNGTLSVTAVNGLATFSDLSLETTGLGYTLTATSTDLTAATSSPFNITAGAASKLVFGVGPSNTTAGTNLSPAITVLVQDDFGNLVTTTDVDVTLAVSGSGVPLTGTTTVTSVNGVATFSTVSLEKAGTGYALTATADGLTADTTSTFDVSAAAAAKLSLVSQPSSTVAGMTFAATVVIQDRYGNTALSAADQVTLTLDNAAGATLDGTTSVAASNGIATFTGLKILKAGSGYTLTASSGSLASVTSSTFDVSPTAPASLSFGAQPSNIVAGTSIPAVSVYVLDQFDNLATGSTSFVTIALTGDTAGTALSGTKTALAVNGVATFSNLSLTQAGTGYTLVASSDSVTPETSSTFNVTADVAASLHFSADATNTVAGAAISPAVAVSVVDQYGNAATGASAPVTIAFAVNPTSATLNGTLTVTPSNGVATFSNLSIQKAGTGYKLTATSGTLTSALSQTFNVTPGAVAKAAFTSGPTNSAAGAAISPAITVTLADTYDNTVTSSTASVTLALGSNPSSATLVGTTTASAVSGVATFSNVSLQKVGTGYTLVASSNSITPITSASFDVSVGAATQLVFTGSPSNIVAGASITPAVSVAIKDAYGNTTAGTNSVTLALTNAAGATLAGTLTVSAVNGVASFSDLTVTKAGTGYALSATASGLTSASSGGFTVQAGTAAAVQFSAQPSNVTTGTAISPAVEVRTYDAYGNFASSSGVSVTLALGNNPSSATLSGTLTKSTSNGIATFSDLAVDQAGTAYTLVATAGAFPAVTSNAFNATAAGPTLPNPGHVVISEISGGTTSSATDEFVELYNPTSSDVDLTNWTVQYKSATGAAYSGTYTISASNKHIIKAHGYFLVCGATYSLAATAACDGTYTIDMSASTTAGGHIRIGPSLTASNLADPATVDKIGWGTGNSPEGTAAPSHPASGGSLERKALSTSTSPTMATNGSDAAYGNGYDTDNNSTDFVTRAARQPQSSTSANEP